MSEASARPDAAAGSPMNSVDKALLALDALAGSGAAGLGLAELARLVGANKTTLHRTLAALRYRGYVDQTPTGAYRLAAAAITLGTTYLREDNLPGLLRPALVAICAQVGELVHLGVLAGREIVYLDKIEPERSVRVWSAVGRHRPAATTAMGRAWLAALETAPGAVPLDDATLDFYSSGVTSRDHLRAALDAAHERGHAEENEETEPGISCIAVAILRSGRPVAAVSITAPVERLPGAARIEHARVLADILSGCLPEGLTVASV